MPLTVVREDENLFSNCWVGSLEPNGTLEYQELSSILALKRRFR